MSPDLFGVVSAYATMLTLAIVVGFGVALRSARRDGVDVRKAIPVLIVPIVPALLGAKLYCLIERGGAYSLSLNELYGGYRYPGGVVGWLLAILASHWLGLLPVSSGRLADIVAPSFGFSLMIMRVGCLLTGCCSGRVSNLPWAIQFPRDSQVWSVHVQAGIISSDSVASARVHPLQVYFGLLALGLGCFTLWLQRHKAYDGQVFLAFLTLYSLGQFFLEFLRFTSLPHVQYLSLLIAIIGCTVIMTRSERAVPAPTQT